MVLRLLHATDAIFWLQITISIGLLYYLYRIIPEKKWYRILIGMRILLFILFIFLLLNPVLTINSEKESYLDWGIFVDNSASIKNHKMPSLNAIQSGLKESLDQLSEKNIAYQLYHFDASVNKQDGQQIDGSGLTTNIANLSLAIRKIEHTLSNAIIISDGIITEGNNHHLDFNKIRIPIHTIGIGKGSEMVDVSVQSIDVPTVVLKSDGVNVHAIIQSVGNIQDRLSVSLYHEKELLGSKHIRLAGFGSKKDINFRFQPKEIGKQRYEIRISSVEDEINILNNKQNFDLLVIKDRYKVAMITGSPNKNTSVLKRFLKENPRIEIDHFVRINEARFKPEIKSFWSSPYELIILENYPVEPLSTNFVRILGKKILTHQSAIMLVSGPNQSNKSLNGITSILGVRTQDSSIETTPLFWDFMNLKESIESDRPPLTQKLAVFGKGQLSDSLAIFESGWPMWLQNQIGNIRTSVITAADIHLLYYQKRDGSNDNLFSNIFNKATGWLLKSGNSHENYFRLNKDHYQQGEIVRITGSQPFENNQSKQSINIQVTGESSNVISKDIIFNIESNRWEGEFRAPSQGHYTYQIFMDSGQLQIQAGKFQVLESQIELNQVHLNQTLMKSISEVTNGQYYHWDDRNELIQSASQKVRRELKGDFIKFKENKPLLILIVIFLCIEWIIRRNKGLS